MNFTSLVGGKILMPSGITQNDGLHFDKFIHAANTALSDIESISNKQASASQRTYDLPENWLITPGFVDIHIHGCSDYDVMDATPHALATIANTLVKHGVTSFLGTTMTMGQIEIEQALNNARAYLENQPTLAPLGAKMWGVHLEGPFISPKAVGAQNPDFIQKPSLQLIDAYKDILKIVTYAPEEDDNFELTKALSSMGIVPSIGHTACNYDTAYKAFQSGASHMTHLFNAMTPLHHREPGAVGAALNLDFTLEIIADNVHIRPELYPLIHKLKNGNLALITDSMRAGCMKCGVYSLGGQKVIVDETSARLENGALAGSVLTLDQAVKNYFDQLQSVATTKATATTPTRTLPSSSLLEDALMSASTVPAAIAGLKETGSIELSKRADLVVLDEHLNVQMTFVEGQLCYQRA